MFIAGHSSISVDVIVHFGHVWAAPSILLSENEGEQGMKGRALARGHAMMLAAEFAERAGGVSELSALASLVETAARELGFRYVALVHHGGPANLPEGRLHLQNYPEAWVAQFQERGLHRHDPVQHAASVRLGGFGWAGLEQLIDLTSAQRTVLQESRKAGLGEGYTVPLHAPSGHPASCSFVTAVGEPFPHRVASAVESVAHSAFAIASQLLGNGKPANRLTSRQRECVVLMAQGKTDWEIGRILGLSEESVTKYLNAARRRFGVARRTQLALAALASGELILAEITTWQ
jgi:LuxR family quorum-sensing system transcriptional regulator CciR